MNDAINPKHYTQHPSGIECIEITRHLSCNRANAIKYLWRCGKKDEANQELQKALWYLKDELNNGLLDVGYKQKTTDKLTKKLDTLALYQTDQERNLFNFIVFGFGHHLKQAIILIEGMIND
jgi:hypothetical protein